MSAKPWYQSRTIWGAILAVLSGLGTMIGIDIKELELDEHTVDRILGAITVVGGFIAFFGRVWSWGRIFFRKNSPSGPTHIAPALLLAAALSLSGCATMTTAQKTSARATGNFAVQKVVNIALGTVVAAAMSSNDSFAKGNILDSLSGAFRNSASASFSAADIARLVEIWTPEEKSHWSNLKRELVAVNADPAAIAAGLKIAAQRARGATANP